MTVRSPLRLLLVSATWRSPLGSRSTARSISFFGWGRKPSEDPTTTTESASSSQRRITDLLKQSPRTSTSPAATDLATQRGALDESSIFGSEDAALPKSPTDLDLTAHRQLRDPDRKNWGWPKKAAARGVRRRGRYSRIELIARTEKEHSAASHFIKTSIKKLAPLARQISGKKVEDAIVQMQFSAKKAARDVLGHLHHAKNEAVVRKGMNIEEMYVAQAWVGRGPFEKELNHRARGRIDILRLPYTSITVVLKEQATLKRIAAEKEAKRLRQSARQHLPSRPIYGQRQYYQW